MSRKKNLLAFFDKADLGVDAIDDWSAFEKKFYGGKERRTGCKRD